MPINTDTVGISVTHPMACHGGCQFYSSNGLPLWVSVSLIQWHAAVGVSNTHPVAYRCGCQCHLSNDLPLWVSVLNKSNGLPLSVSVLDKSNGLPLWVSVSLIQWLTAVGVSFI